MKGGIRICMFSIICLVLSTGDKIFAQCTPPTAYSMGGNVAFCSGGSGVSVTLGGSQTGVNYQLQLNGTSTGAALAGTGSSLTWSSQTAAGNYTIIATNTSTSCTNTMTGTQVVTVNALPTLFTVGGGGAYCNGTGLSITLSGTQPGVNYQLTIGGANSGGPIAGTGAAISWPNKMRAGTWAVVATNTTTSCFRAMTGSVVITTNVLVKNVAGGGTICSGASGASINLSGSQSGVNYQLRIGGTDTGSPVAGTGSALSWTNQSIAGVYTVFATNPTSGCTLGMDLSATVTVNALPALYTVSGGGSYCAGTGLTITLSNSQTGVNYQMKVAGVNSGTAIAGTGSALNWANQTAAGTYTVLATIAATSCAQTMTASAVISSGTLPTLYTVSGGGTICTGAAGVTIALSGSQTGVNYQLKVGSTNSGSAVAGSGAVLSWTNQATAGTYTIAATNALTGCTQTMTANATVTVNPLPTLFTLTGGGAYCAGTGLTISLSGSQSGVSYQLKIGGTNSGTAIAGTGSGLSWTNQTTAGTYTVTATNTTSSCAQAMTGSVAITTGTLPTLFTVSGGGIYCSGIGYSISVSGSQAGVNYQLKINGTNAGTPVAGTGSAINWTNQTTLGTYTVVATNATTLCTQSMTASGAITSGTLPTLYTVSGGGAICVGDAGAFISISGSQTGINYQLKLGGVNTGAPVAGTGASMVWTNQSAAGSYTVLATNASTACAQTMTASAVVTVNPLPTLFTVSGGGAYCTGSGLTVSLSGSQTGVNYQLKIGGVNSGTSMAGTGSSLSWPSLTTAGTYTVVATFTATSCTQAMTSSASITSGTLPTLFTVTGGGTICAGAAGVTITLSGSQTGINYQLKVGGTNIGTAIAGTAATLNWTNQSTAGNYTVVATNATTGCTQPMAASATVVVNALPFLFTVAGSGVYCSGTGLAVTLSGSQNGVNYQLKIGGTNTGTAVAGTGSLLSWTNKTTAGTYTISATNATTSCTQSMTGNAIITAGTLPTIYTVSGGGTYCTGTGFTIALAGSQTGVNYQLKIGGTNSGAALTGTGSALSWTGQTTTGTYTVVATHVATTCAQTMAGSGVITTGVLPTLFVLSGGGSYCNGTGLSVLQSGSQTGVNYQLKNGASNSGAAVAGSGSALSWNNLTTGGTYTVVATNASTGCSQNMSGTVAIYVVSLPTAFTVSGGGNSCSDGTGAVVTLSNSQSGVNYQVLLNGANNGSPVAGTGSAMSFPGQTAAGTYTIKGINAAAGCSQNMTGNATVVLATSPPSSLTGPSVVGADPVTLTANTGAGLTYKWKRDGDILPGEIAVTLLVGQSGSYQVLAIGSNGCPQLSAALFVTKKATAQYNGTIAAARWRTQIPYGVTGSDLTGMYTFDYDDRDELKEAQFSNPNFLLNTFASAGNQFRLADQTYDANGNILSLRRYDIAGVRVNDFTYHYNTLGTTIQQTNKLNDIQGHSNYTYNTVGQMTGDDQPFTGSDKFVDYDVVGKVTRVWADVSKTQIIVSYTYDDHGLRLSKTNYQAQRTTWYIRDGVGNVISIYETDHQTASSNQTEIPLYGAGKLGTYYPVPGQVGSASYELTDQLGNVRALVQERQNVYTATMEDNGIADLSNPRVQELQYFQNIPKTDKVDANMNHTGVLPAVPVPSHSAYLFWNDNAGTQAIDKSIGPAVTLKVNAGDTLKIEAFARYQNQSSYSRDVDLLLLSSLLGNSFLHTNGIDNLTSLSTMFQNGLGAAGFWNDTDATRPYAYLNYMLFNESFVFVDGGAWRVDNDGQFYPGGELPKIFDNVKFASPIVTTQKGYVYVWVSNESKGAKVWFDDIKITQTQGIVIQATDYDPWGVITNNLKSPEEIDYRFAYQGQFAEKDAETSWQHFRRREFDPIIGRWTSVDPKRQFHSSYLGMANNPVNGFDPDGGDVIILSAPQGAMKLGHAALLVGNDQTGWTYISKDGTNQLGGFYGKANQSTLDAVNSKKFATLQDFLGSSFNQDKDTPSQSEYHFGLQIVTDEASDANIIASARSGAVETYDLIFSNCMQNCVIPLVDEGILPKRFRNTFFPNETFDNLLDYFLSDKNFESEDLQGYHYWDDFGLLKEQLREGTITADAPIFEGAIPED